MAVDGIDLVSVSDVKSAARDGLAALQQGPVYFLIDLSTSSAIDVHAIELPQFSAWIHHPNARWFVYVQADGVFKALVQVRQRDSARFFQSRHDALAFLQKAVEYASQE